jgi:hypothetical protein
MYKHIFVSISIVMTLFVACSRKEKATVDVSGIDFAEGDLVFRRGLGAKSRAVLVADVDGVYSHSGIVVKQDTAFMIVHITPGEREEGVTEDRIKMETPERFFSADRAQHGAVYRLPDSLNILTDAAQHAIRLYNKGILFDHDYTLKDTTTMYCTEFVSYVYQLAGKNIVTSADDHIFPSNIYENKEFSIIYKF